MGASKIEKTVQVLYFEFRRKSTI